MRITTTITKTTDNKNDHNQKEDNQNDQNQKTITRMTDNLNDPGRSPARPIDTDLYSRQIGTFGIEMMGKLQRLRVLIIGLRASGVEIAKNLALMGVASLTLLDDDLVERKFLGVNFFLRGSDVGVRSVAEAVAPHVQRLNPNVGLSVVRGGVSETLLLDHDVVVCCDQPFDLLTSVNKICRGNSAGRRIGFIAADTFGFVASVFVDFGHNFTCFDPSGNPLKTGIVAGVTQESPAVVLLYGDKPTDFQTGDLVKFSEVEGMTELNALPPTPITVNAKNSFLIGDTTKLSPYLRGGIVTEVRQPITINFRSFEECILHPSETSLATIDYSLEGRAEQLHWISMGFRMEKGDRIRAEKRAMDLVSEARSCRVEKVDLGVFESFWRRAGLRVSPVASFVGGVVAQEVVKFTGKYHPINQWLYCDFTCPLPSPEEEFSSTGFDSRYADQVALWGRSMQNRIQNAKIFLVGSGALGCEFMKHFALLGCATQGEGSLVVTDDDRIETSNISRQFLFRAEHVGQSKAMVADVAAREINEGMRIMSLEMRVGEESEEFFDEQFWGSLGVVVNALDNVKARQYVDGKCVWYEKPLLESGTLGTLGNVQVVIPHMTQCYSESQDPPEDSIPLCTLKHFPYQVEHAIEWARDAFQGIFNSLALDLGKIRKQADDCEDVSLDNLELLVRLSRLTQDDLKWQLLEIGAFLFNRFFVNDILQLLYSFPPDHVNADGQPFWSPPKRTPKELVFQAEDRFCALFLVSTAKLLGDMIAHPTQPNPEDVPLMPPTQPTPFTPKILKLAPDSSNVEVVSPFQPNRSSLLNEILNSKIELTPIEFEKDDDSNFHIDFIWSCAVLRCRNYNIPECDRMKAKLISGKIIPAIATTTAMIGGLVMLEFVKAVCYKKFKIEHFRNCFACLATPVWLQSEPLGPTLVTDKEFDPVVGGPVRALPKNFSVWDKLVVCIPNGSVRQLVGWIKGQFGVEVVILSSGNLCLYNALLPVHRRERQERGIRELVETLSKSPLNPKSTHIVIEASCSDEKEVDVILPTIKFQFK